MTITRMIIGTERGYTLIQNANNALHSIALSFVICKGSKHEPLHLQGITHLFEHMCFRKSGELSQKELYREIEQNGLILKASTAPDHVSFDLKCTKLSFKKAISLLVDMLFYSEWTDEELRKEKQIITEELNYSNYLYNYPEIKSKYFNNYYPETIIGTKESLKKITLDELLDFKKKLLEGAEKYIFICGNFSNDEVLLIKEMFPDFEYENDSLITSKNVAKNLPYVSYEKSRDIDVTFICLFDKTKFKHEHIALLKSILFEGLGSKFFFEIREEMGMLYDFDSQLTYNEEQGLLLVNIELDEAEKIEPVLLELVKCLEYAKEKLSDEDLKSAIPFFTGNLYYYLDDPQELIDSYISDLTNFGRVLGIDENVKIYSDVSFNDLQDVAKKIFKKENCYFIFSGRYSKKEKQKINKIIEKI